jgi:hypothetical protein
LESLSFLSFSQASCSVCAYKIRIMGPGGPRPAFSFSSGGWKDRRPLVKRSGYSFETRVT